MRLKQRPEDFVVSESWRFDKTAKGEYRVYQLDKQKLSTFDAITRLADTFKLPKAAFSYCGLKDKQGRTTQLIAVKGAEIEMQEPDLRLKFLGRSPDPVTAANTTSNRFGVTVRDLSEDEVSRLPGAVAEVNRLGLVNYFDSQRFGSLKHGQGFIAKDLIRGDFELALKNFLAKPSPLDRSNDAKVKAFWRDHWGQWRLRCTIEGAQKYERILNELKRDRRAFREAFLRIDPKYRAMQIFTYQSWLWNECVRRFLVALLPGQSLLAISYQAGKLLFPREMPAEILTRLRTQTMPLLAPESTIADPDVKKAVDWVLGREKLTVERLHVPETPEIFFRHEERPVLVFPGKLMHGPPRDDEENRGRKKIYVAFTLPPGAYATLVVRRLFHYSQEESLETIEPETPEKPTRARPAKPSEPAVASGAPAPRPEPQKPPPPPPEPRLGYRARQKLKKEKKAVARAQAPEGKGKS